MRLLIIRHGESEADILNVHEGRADFELTERGRRQAQAMSSYAATNYKIDKIYHSTLRRAEQTAAYLSDATGAPMIPEDRLMEFNNGLLAGLPYDEAAEKYATVDLPIHEAAYEQESMLEFRFRAEYMLSKLISENTDDSTVAVVTHGGMINQLYRAFLRIPADTEYAFRSFDACIHEWLVEGSKRTVVRANMMSHDI